MDHPCDLVVRRGIQVRLKERVLYMGYLFFVFSSYLNCTKFENASLPDISCVICPYAWVLSSHVSLDLGSFCSCVLRAEFFLLMCP